MVSLLYSIGFVAVGWITGLILYHAGSVFLGVALPRRYGFKIARYHLRESVRALKRFLIHIRERKDVVLAPSKPNTEERGGERLSYHGEVLDFDDPSDLMTYCFNKPCGIALEATQSIVDPIVAEAGAAKARMIKQNNFERDLEQYTDDLGVDDDTEPAYGWAALPVHFPVPRSLRGPRMDHALQMMTAGTPPNSVHTARNLIEKAFQGFNSPNSKQLFVLGMLFGAGLGAVIVMDMIVNGGSASGGGGGGAPTPTATPGENVRGAWLIFLCGIRGVVGR